MEYSIFETVGTFGIPLFMVSRMYPEYMMEVIITHHELHNDKPQVLNDNNQKNLARISILIEILHWFKSHPHSMQKLLVTYSAGQFRILYLLQNIRAEDHLSDHVNTTKLDTVPHLGPLYH